jgi:hypothetical protein
MLSNLTENLDKVIAEVAEKVTPQNIRAGVEIFGIQGSLPKMISQHKKIEPKAYTQIVTPDMDKNALHSVLVDTVKATVDPSIQPHNIRHGESILGVEGYLSSLTEEEYNQMLLLEFEILGYTIYVFRSRLVLTGEDYSVEDKTLKIKGTVENGVLKIN